MAASPHTQTPHDEGSVALPATERPQASAPGARRPRSGRRLAILVAAGLALIVGAISLLVVGVRGRDDTATGTNGSVRIAPDTIDAIFQIDSKNVQVGAGQVIAEVGRYDRIVRYDENGDERWSFDAPNDWEEFLVAPEIDGKIPIEIRSNSHEPGTYIGFLDADTGELTGIEIGFDPGMNRITYPTFGDRLYFWSHANIQSQPTIEMYDPDTGDRAADISGDVVEPQLWAGVFVAVDGYTLSVYNRDLQPIVTDIAVDDQASRHVIDEGDVPAIDVVDGTVITVDGNLIVGNDNTGVAWTLDPGVGELLSARSIGDDAWLLGLVDGDTVILNRNGSDGFDEVWRGADMEHPQRIGDDRVLFGGRALLMVNANGDELYSVDQHEFWEDQPLDNGFLVGADRVDGAEVTFVDLDGNERWTIKTETPASQLQVGDGMIFDLGDGTVYGSR